MFITQIAIYVAFGIFALWTIYIVRLMNYWFSSKFNYLKGLRLSDYPKLSAFVRDDRDRWNRLQLTLGAVFLLPLRVTSTLLVILIGMLGNQALIAVFGIENIEKEQPSFFVLATRKWIQAIAKVVLWVIGYGSIKKGTRTLDTKRHPKLKQSNMSDNKAGILISNHVSMFDVVYFLSTNYTPSFMARAGVKNMPMIGAFARVLQCIFVNRVSDQRNQVKEQLTERVKNIQDNRNFNSVLIFPEGTCTNGKVLGQFKKGAFMLGSPLKIFFIKYNGMFDATLVNMNELESSIGILSDWSKSIEVWEIEGLVEPAKPMEWQEYADAVRNLMADEFNLGTCDATLNEKIELENKLCGFTEKDFV